MTSALVPADVTVARLEGAISPSAAEAEHACGLRGLLRHSSAARRLRRLTPAAALGVAAHALLETAGGQTGAELEARWDALIADAYRQMLGGPALVPPAVPDRWPRYQAVRVRALRAAASIVARAGGEPTYRRAQATAVAERALLSRDGRVVGRPDRVEVVDGVTRVVDVKTGGRDSDGISDHERRQLLFYAYLWHEVHGAWPAVGCIELGSAQLEFAIDPAESPGFRS